MKVADLKKGMVLYVSDSDKIAWLSEKNLVPTGEPEVRFVPKVMNDLLPGRPLDKEELIIYLGHDMEPVDKNDPDYKSLVRRVMVKEKTAVILGYNFKYLDPHPDFVR